VKSLCESTESLAEEVRKIKKTGLGETDLDAITSARKAREDQEANQAVVGALAEQVHTLREEVAALKRAGAGEGWDAGRHCGGKFKGEDEATWPNDEMTKSASASEAAKLKKMERWYRLFAQAAVSPAPGWTIGDAGTSNRLQSWEIVVTTLSALGQEGLGSGPTLTHVDCELFTVRRIAELLDDLMAQIDEHPQHEDDGSDDDSGSEVRGGRCRPREPQSLQGSQGMQVSGRELRAQQRAAMMAIKSLPVMGSRGNEPTRGRRSIMILLQGLDDIVRATAYPKSFSSKEGWIATCVISGSWPETPCLI